MSALITLETYASTSLQRVCIHIVQAAVSWQSLLPSIVALSTTVAEYMATTEVMKEAIWLQGLLDDLGIEL